MPPTATANDPAAASGRVRWHDLWWQLTLRAIETRHRGSHLGITWSVLNPLLMLALYFTVFGFVFKSTFRGETPQEYALGVFLGLMLFHVFSEVLGSAPVLVVSQPNLVKKVVFPVELLPLAHLGAIWFHCGISLLLMLGGLMAFGPGLTLAGTLWLPAILAPLILLSAGLAWMLSALGVFLRDISQLVPLASQLLLWSSCIFFTPEKVRAVPLAWKFLKWNPLLQGVDLARDALLWHEAVDLGQYAYLWSAALVVFVVGRWLFRKLQPAFADVI